LSQSVPNGASGVWPPGSDGLGSANRVPQIPIGATGVPWSLAGVTRGPEPTLLRYP